MPLSNKNGELMPWSSTDRLIETIRDMFGEQSAKIGEQSAILSAQSQRLDRITLQISTIGNQQDALRNDFNQRWGDLPKIYIPRQEMVAMGLDGRITSLEELHRKTQSDVADMKLALQQQIQQSVLAMAHDLAKVQLDEQADTSKQRSELDGRSILLYSTALLALISIVVTIVLHFI